MAANQMNSPGFAGFGAGAAQPQAAAPASAINADKLSATDKADYTRALKFKEEGDKLVKEKKFDEASEKYNQSLNVVRGNDSLKKDNCGADVEIRARSNLALCKWSSEAWTDVIDQSERVIERAESNDTLKAAHSTIIAKSCFRWADALYKRADGDEDLMGASDIKIILKMSKRANDLMQGKNAQIKELWDKVKDLKVPEPEEKKEEAAPEEIKQSEKDAKAKSGKLRGVKIDDSDDEPQIDTSSSRKKQSNSTKSEEAPKLQTKSGLGDMPNVNEDMMKKNMQ